ncbi:MAG: hypothetical protein JST93_13140 [Acidobacteria bacterium]|nr:hypothetical protein [Acidobacteriota bacterium]
MTLGKRIGAGFGLVIAFLLGLSLLTTIVTTGASSELAAVDEQYLPVAEMATECERHLLNARIHYAYYLTIQKPGSLENGTERLAKVKALVARLSAAVNGEDAFAAVRPPVKHLEEQLRDYEATRQEVEEAITSGKWTPEVRQALTVKWANSGGQMSAAIAEVNKRATAMANAATRGLSTRLRNTTVVMMGAGLLVTLLSMAASWWIARGLTRELKQNVDGISQGAALLLTAAGQVTSASQSLAQGASEQAASLEETSASTQEIHSTARRNSDSSRTAAGLMTQSEEKFGETNRLLDQTLAAMGEINAQSGKISKIIKTIDEIAFQTNILALNAAVEAARAGEAGMGFAVVADEVRRLAQRCAQAASDTSQLIEESIGKSKAGQVKVDQVAGSIRAVTGEMSKVKMLIDAVNVGSEEQLRGIDQIVKAIQQMEQVTQQTAAGAEESAAVAGELNAQSKELNEVVGRLTMMVGGGK